MNKNFSMVLLCVMLFSFNQVAYAEDYKECKIRCNQELAACKDQKPDTPAQQQTAATKAVCLEKLEACYVGCKALQQQSANNVDTWLSALLVLKPADLF